jgi:predicted ATPase with chaperone activity
MITYYLIGLLTGVSLTTFFIGKELYKYYTKFKIQQKQLNRILKLNDKIKDLKNLKSIELQNVNMEAIAS